MESLTGLTTDATTGPATGQFDLIYNISEIINRLGGSLGGMDSIKVTSFVLIGAAFMLLLLMLCILYIKSMIVSNSKMIGNVGNSISSEETAKYKRKLEEEKEKTRELLAKEKEEEQNIFVSQQKEIQEEEFRKVEQLREKENKKEKRKQKLDWNKEAEHKDMSISERFGLKTASYQQKEQDLSELTGLVMDMIVRKVDDYKIAQALMYKTGGKASEEEILQLVSAIHNVINMSNSGEFREILAHHGSPDGEQQALELLANGDPSIILMLLEEKIDIKINKGTAMSYGPMKIQTLNDAAELSCDFGTLASLCDGNLAVNSLELATELQPKNVNAWSRLADNYLIHNTQNKAIWAYQNVLSLSDKKEDRQIIANANYKLGSIYIAQGNERLGRKMIEQSQEYYEFIGISHALSEKEQEVMEVIEAKYQDEISQTVERLLSQRGHPRRRMMTDIA